MKSRILSACLVLKLLLASQVCEAKSPNVLFISVDDLNSWSGYNGNKQVISPNLDRLASESVWFSKAYCQYPVCGPSRASLMSGMYFHQLKSKKLQMKDQDVSDTVASMGSSLLHEHFKKNGYKTMAVGKILHKHLPKKSLNLSGGRGGWDTHEDSKGNRVKTYWKSNETLTDWGPMQKPESKMSDSKAADWAVERLKKKHKKPFFLMVGFLRPHVPWYVPQKYYDMYDREKLIRPPYKVDDLDDVPEAGKGTLNKGYPRTEWAKENNQWQHILQSYMASITFVDTKIGQVLKALEESEYSDNTIVVLWSDHGYHLGEKNTFQKHTLWERSAVAPLIVKLPKEMSSQMKKGRRDQIVGLIDLYPTLVDLCGLPANDKVAGRSLSPLIRDPKKKWNFPALTYRKDNGKSIRNDRYRYIEYGDGSTELYDHQVDPNEWHNLAGKKSAGKILKSMQKLLKDYHVE